MIEGVITQLLVVTSLKTKRVSFGGVASLQFSAGTNLKIFPRSRPVVRGNLRSHYFHRLIDKASLSHFACNYLISSIIVNLRSI